MVLSLILDNEDGSKDTIIWNSYYHLYLDDKSLDHVSNQIKKLYGLSASLDHWHNSRFGATLRFCDSGTLARVRRYWQVEKYCAVTEDQKEEIGKRFAFWIEKTKTLQRFYHGNRESTDYFNLSGLRSAGPASLNALTDLPQHFNHYWKHGSTDADANALAMAKWPNPMFAASMEDTSVLHYGTDPLLGFHLATAYTSLASSSPLRLPAANYLPKAVATARLQLKAWSLSFRERKESITIRFCSGDALALCHTLQHMHTAGTGSQSNWYRERNRYDTLVLDSEDYVTTTRAPLLFNVIDTSNLGDHLGPLNVLISAAPLLDTTSSAVLYLDSLVRIARDAKSQLDELLCGHFPTVSLLLGLTPVEYWTNSTACSSVDDYMMEDELLKETRIETTSSQIHNRFSFKRSTPESLGRCALAFDPTELAHVFHRIYLNMFQHENFGRMLSDISLRTIQKSSVLHHHRGSLASFLLYVKRTVITDWRQAMSSFLHLIEEDSTIMMRMNYIQELYLQMHGLGLYSVDLLRSPLRKSVFLSVPLGLQAWKEVPATVCITLQVPRSRLRVLTELEPEKIGTPILQCVLQSSHRYKGRRWQNIFSMTQLAFGTFAESQSTQNESLTLEIKEDPLQWKGSSTLFASFMVPSWILALEPDTGTVALGVHSTPQSAGMLLRQLGIEMTIYKTNLSHQTDVYFTKYLPNLSGNPSVCNFSHLSLPAKVIVSKDSLVSIKANVDKTAGRITTLTGRIDIAPKGDQAKLRNGANVEMIQVSPCKIGFKIDGCSARLDIGFPVPVLWSRSKCRIARKSSYLEVVAPFADHTQGDGFPDFLHPVFLEPGGPVLWNMPRLRLNRLPVFDISMKDDLKWLTLHTDHMWTSQERASRNEHLASSTMVARDARYNLKDSLFSLFMHFSGLQGGKAEHFGIYDPDGGGVHMLVFVTCLRLDLSNRTPILDAVILPLSKPLLPRMGGFLVALNEIGLCQIKVNSQELKLWKEMLPVWVERCRDWEHSSKCEYQLQKRIPLSLDFGVSPLCSCGQGSVSKKPKLDLPHWDTVAKYAVRAAISPSLPFPFTEQAMNAAESKEQQAEELSEEGINRVLEQVQATCAGDACRVCGAKKSADSGKALKKCSRCKIVRYCSQECQRRDWEEHKMMCGDFVKMSKSLKESLKQHGSS